MERPRQRAILGEEIASRGTSNFRASPACHRFQIGQSARIRCILQNTVAGCNIAIAIRMESSDNISDE
ncbi:hypothetical protein GE253_22185 [Niveispirillum sp. SYP-B3756]|uniref:hypothetical protein n=1 Tax=Niveispirillum sp. SYP-B3756 TaxID=2662178 RepID=UPI001291C28C|nr:hypothetical protein [Niveispirillum sp. SYP-B3756]MQP68030.1 hypothetical protein [Niveispirillum sp. SYP-B3756]